MTYEAIEFATSVSGILILPLIGLVGAMVGILYRQVKADNRDTRAAVIAQGDSNDVLKQTVTAVKNAVNALETTVATMRDHDQRTDERMELLIRSGSRLEQVMADHLKYAESAETRIENRLNLRKDDHG